jgi:hypothetical protein
LSRGQYPKRAVDVGFVVPVSWSRSGQRSAGVPTDPRSMSTIVQDETKRRERSKEMRVKAEVGSTEDMGSLKVEYRFPTIHDTPSEPTSPRRFN